nr:AraC family transcriptional regulator [uncultured Allomuricauda sp.]
MGNIKTNLEDEFKIRKPSNQYLQSWVDYYFFIDIPVSELKLKEEFVFPFPRITFGYFFEHPFLVTNHSTNEECEAEMIISRVSNNQISVKPLTDRVKIIGAHIKPYALALLTNDNISQMPWIIRTEDVFKETAQKFKKKVDSCASPNEMFLEIENAFLNSVLSKDLVVIIQAIDLIEKEKGDISISSLSDTVGVSTRTLRNHFYKSVGCSPKDYITLVKLRWAVYQMNHSSDSLTTISYVQNFADQAHFTHTFKNIYGDNPRKIQQKLPSFRFLQF